MVLDKQANVQQWCEHPGGAEPLDSPRVGLLGRMVLGRGDAEKRISHDYGLGPCRWSQVEGKHLLGRVLPSPKGREELGLHCEVPGSFELGDIDLCFESKSGCRAGWVRRAGC